MDCHRSHIITIEVIEFARSNDIHLLRLPSHTPHILQLLDVHVSVFKSFLSRFSLTLKAYVIDTWQRILDEL